MFGSDSYALMARKPELSFAKVYRMLGRDVEHPLVKELKSQYFPYEFYINETTKSTTLKMEDTYYTPEELVAMLLNHVKEMTLNFGGKKIKDCVITVPSSFTQHEREAVYTAAEIADLNILSLIEENTAAALHYGIDRVFEEPKTVLYYNLGAGSVQVSVVTYSSYGVKEAGKNKTIGQFEVLGKAWDSSLGGFNFDVQLANLLANRFNEVWGKKASGKGKDLKDFYRPMTRLRIEANKVKEVLSANNEYPVKAEQLHADTDLVTKVTRAEFEEACKDLFARLTDPIDKALAMANISVSDIHAVELLGGGVRMPKVKKVLDDYFQSSKVEVGQHLNGDEAMALGAAFRAANLSTAFRVRKVGASDLSSFGVAVRLSTLDTDADTTSGGGFFSSFLNRKKATKPAASESGETAWNKYTTLYPFKSLVPSKVKTVAFQYDKDILCSIEYDDVVALPEGTDKLLAVYNITGIAAFSQEVVGKGLNNTPKVHLSFGLDSSGIVTLIKAEATVELPVVEEPEPVSVSNSTEADPSSASNSTDSESVPIPTNSTETDTNSTSSNSTSTDTKKNSKDSKSKADKKKNNTLRKQLLIHVNRNMISPVVWSPTQIVEARLRLRALQDADDLRKAKEAALNELEAFIYKVKNRISDDEDKLKAVSTEEQRQEVVDLANAAEEWLYDEGRDQSVEVYKNKQGSIASKANAIFKRHSEVAARQEAVTKAKGQLQEVRKIVDGWSEKSPHITEEEKQKLLEAVEKAEKWIQDKLDEQAKVSAFEEPVFDSTDVPLQLKNLSIMFDKLARKPKPAPPIVDKNSTSSNSTDSSTGPETVKVEVNSDEASNSTSSETKKEPATEEKEKEEL